MPGYAGGGRLSFRQGPVKGVRRRDAETGREREIAIDGVKPLGNINHGIVEISRPPSRASERPMIRPAGARQRRENSALRRRPWKSRTRSAEARRRRRIAQRAAAAAEARPRKARRGKSMTSSTCGFPASSGAHSELMSHWRRVSGQRRLMSATAGRVWTMSPRELGLITRMERGARVALPNGSGPSAGAGSRKAASGWLTCRAPTDPRAAAEGRHRRFYPGRSRCRTRCGAIPRAGGRDSKGSRRRASRHRAAGRRNRH